MEVPQGDYRTMAPARVVKFLLDYEDSLLEKQAVLKAYAAAVEGPTTDDLLRVFSRLSRRSRLMIGIGRRRSRL